MPTIGHSSISSSSRSQHPTRRSVSEAQGGGRRGTPWDLVYILGFISEQSSGTTEWSHRALRVVLSRVLSEQSSGITEWNYRTPRAVLSSIFMLYMRSVKYL